MKSLICLMQFISPYTLPLSRFVCVGTEDSEVRVLRYSEATLHRVGAAHCGAITAVQVSAVQ